MLNRVSLGKQSHIPSYLGPQPMLLGDLQTLGEVLVHSESHLRKTIAENMQVGLVLYHNIDQSCT